MNAPQFARSGAPLSTLSTITLLVKREVDSVPDDDGLEVENYILALAYAPGKSGRVGEPLGGKTVLQKLLFHLRKGVEDSRGSKEMPHFYGPFDEQAEVVAEQLEASGYLRIGEPLIELTSRGMQEARTVWESELVQRERDIISELKAYFADLSVDEILAITYAKYPETAANSVVKKELDRRGKAVALGLVRKGKVSMDLAARIAGMSLREFMQELSKHRIAVIERET